MQSGCGVGCGLFDSGVGCEDNIEFSISSPSTTAAAATEKDRINS